MALFCSPFSSDQLSPTGDCRRAYMRLSYCSLCRGTPALKPCNGFCLNVLKGCLASTMEMDSEWERFLGEMEEGVGTAEHHT